MGRRSRERKERVIAGLEEPIAMTDDQKAKLKEFKKAISSPELFMPALLALQSKEVKHEIKPE